MEIIIINELKETEKLQNIVDGKKMAKTVVIYVMTIKPKDE